MEFYAGMNQVDRPIVCLYFTEREAQQLGPLGTKLSLRENVNGPEGTYILRPDPESRAKLHRNVRTGEWEVATTIGMDNFPKSGRTTIIYNENPDGSFLLRPNEVELKEPKPSGRRGPSHKKREVQPLPNNLPPRDQRDLTRRAMVGAPATLKDLKEALEILNDVLQRLEGVEVVIYPENPIGDDAPEGVALTKRRIRAKVTTVEEL